MSNMLGQKRKTKDQYEIGLCYCVVHHQRSGTDRKYISNVLPFIVSFLIVLSLKLKKTKMFSFCGQI